MKPLRLLFVLMLVLVILGFSGSVYFLHVQGDRLLSVQTNSMLPVLKRGDAVITRTVALSELKLNDIVSYKSPADNRVTVTHRLVEINYQTGRLVTIGDNNQLADQPIPASLVIGKVYKILPGFGRLLDWQRTPLGLTVVLYIPASLVLFFETKHLSYLIAYKRYREHIYFTS